MANDSRKRDAMMEKAPTTTPENLGKAHASLLEDLRKLEQSLRAGGAGVSTLDVRTQLASTHTHITNHFGFQEQNGWRDSVRKQEPRLDHAVQNLLEEHRQLVQSLNTLSGEAEAIEDLDDAFRDKVLRWIHRVRDHEARENDLLEDAIVEDLGTGD
jgi:hypothetical protein